MRALVFASPHDIAVQQRPTPEPAADEVRVRVIATGICGSDVHGFTGENGRRFPDQVMGHETVGRIDALGASEGSDLEIGQLVTINPVIGCGHCPACQARHEQLCPDRRVIGVNPEISSAFADYLVAPTGNVVPLPEAMPAYVGALTEPLAVGYHAAVRGRVADGSRVLVVGGGPIGQAAALAAKRLGGTVLVSEPNPARRQLLAKLGCACVDPTQIAEASLATLAGKPDVVLDAVGTSSSLASALSLSAIGATIVVVGMNSPQVQLDAYLVSTQERSLIGSFCYSSQEFADTAAWVGQNAEMLTTLIDDVVPMDEAPDMFAALAGGTSAASKILVRTADESEAI